jgi:mannose-6-phosphate isomerase-like protein (cupin superfamily)
MKAPAALLAAGAFAVQSEETNVGLRFRNRRCNRSWRAIHSCRNCNLNDGDKTMAAIILDPGEIFEHSHITASITHLRRGSIRCRHGSESILMQVGQRLEIPGGVPHVLENTGARRAYVDCYHCPAPGDDVIVVEPPNPGR